jgi:hypothetical protein
MQGTIYVRCMNVVPLARPYAADDGETTDPGRSCCKTRELWLTAEFLLSENT